MSICVPTPLRKRKIPTCPTSLQPPMRLRETSGPGQLIILESTTYPGTTEELILTALEASGLRVGRDFFLAFSPERVDPVNRIRTQNIPKVVGGVTPVARSSPGCSMAQHENDRPRFFTAWSEMVKLLENTFRSVNIALANEIAMMCSHMNIDVWEVIKGASSNLSGSCRFIPDLVSAAIAFQSILVSGMEIEDRWLRVRFIGLADKINSGMPRFVVTRRWNCSMSREKRSEVRSPYSGSDL